MDSLIWKLSENNKLMGSLAISKNGKQIYSAAINTINPSEKLPPINHQSKFRIGSITKMFTSVMIFQLVEEKKLKADSRLSEFYPELPNADKITITDLLTHHSGLHNFTNDESYLSYYTKAKSQAELLSMFKQMKPDFAPGAKAEYSNTNFVVLGFIIEKLDKRSYAESLKKRIVDKIGLKDTFYGSRIDTKNNEMLSYAFTDNKWVAEKETDMSIPHGAGAIVSTPNDLSTFIEALFSYKLLKKESLDEMKTLRDNFGKGIFQFPFGKRSAYGHDGGIDGFVSSLAYFPEDSLSIAITSNGLNYNMNDILIGVLSIVFNQPYSIPTFTSIKLPEEKLIAYEGVYASKQIPIKITLKKENGSLSAQATNQPSFLLDAQNETTFSYEKVGAVLSFKIETDGKINSFVLKQGGGEFLFEKEN